VVAGAPSGAGSRAAVRLLAEEGCHFGACPDGRAQLMGKETLPRDAPGFCALAANGPGRPAECQGDVLDRKAGFVTQVQQEAKPRVHPPDDLSHLVALEDRHRPFGG
jgi:hypothetical protein